MQAIKKHFEQKKKRNLNAVHLQCYAAVLFVEERDTSQKFKLTKNEYPLRRVLGRAKRRKRRNLRRKKKRRRRQRKRKSQQRQEIYRVTVQR